MNDEPLDPLEQHFASLPLPSAPSALRCATLADVRRELRAARWDRRLARTAAVLLFAGVGLNAALVISPSGSFQMNANRLAHDPAHDSLLEAALVVSEATDAKTGSQFAQHMATLSGRTLSGDELAAIVAAIEQQSHHKVTNGEG